MNSFTKMKRLLKRVDDIPRHNKELADAYKNKYLSDDDLEKILLNLTMARQTLASLGTKYELAVRSLDAEIARFSEYANNRILEEVS